MTGIETVKRRVRKHLARHGVFIHRGPNRGFSPNDDIRKAVAKRKNIEVIFDVGANIGQSTIEYHSIFRDAKIYTFEPGKEAYKELLVNTKHLYPAIENHELALSNAPSIGFMTNNDTTECNRLIDESIMESVDDEDNTILNSVEISTVSRICAKYNIEAIDILKIDTEGSDLKVLEGAYDLIERQKIQFIQVEAGLDPLNIDHVPFIKFANFFEETAYRIFGIYEQYPSTGAGRLAIRRCNIIYALEAF